MVHKRQKQETPAYIEQELDKAGRIAHHYGFTPIKAPRITTEDSKKAKVVGGDDFYTLEREERIALLNFFAESPFASIPQPALFYLKKPFPGSGQKKKASESVCELEVIGTPKAIAEALILKTAWTILSEYGHDDMYIDINSVGDKESFAKFERELGTYLKKNGHLISAPYRTKFKNRAFDIVQEMDKEVESFREGAPRSVSALSEQSREHFKETLEFLESFGMPYRLANNLIPNKQYSSHTIFEIRKIVKTKKGEESELLAYGGRYNYLAKKVGHKKDIACCGITIVQKGHVADKIVLHDKMPVPKLYAVQLGNQSKLKMLNVIEMLRKEKLPVYHSLTKEKITGQLSSAEYLDVSHLLIMGQKEAIDDTIIVRSVDTREQETVHLKELVQFLKKVLKK